MKIRIPTKLQVKTYFTSHINQIIFGLYLGTIWNIYFFTLTASYFQDNTIYRLFFFIFAIIVFIIAFLISSAILKIIKKITIKTPHNILSVKQRVSLFLLFFMGTLTVALIWFLAYNPGGFSSDSIDQLNQAINGNYLDWHPALHTILVFTIPYSIFHNIAAIVIFQIIFFALTLAYSMLTIYELIGKKWSIIAFLVIIFNPIVMDTLMFPWKDVTFAIFALLITTISLKIYHSSGTWGNKTWKLILLGIAITITSILRHNGILFTVPLVAFLFFFLDHKQWFKLFACIVVTFFLIKVPLYSALNVTNPIRGAEETLGLPLTVLANVAKTTPEAMDQETSDFMYSIATQEQWQNLYITGDFNSIKWSNINLAPISDLGPMKIIKLTVKNLISSTDASLIALFKATQVVYGVEGTFSHNIPYIASDTAIASFNNTILKQAIDGYRKIFDESILKYLEYTGTTIIALLVFILGKNHWKDNNWKKILLCTPIFFYDFGTMILLTGPEIRFFYINFIIYPIIIVLALIEPKYLKPAHTKKTAST